MFAALRPKTYSNDNNENKKSTKNCVIKRKLKFKNCLEATEFANKINQLGKTKQKSCG